MGISESHSKVSLLLLPSHENTTFIHPCSALCSCPWGGKTAAAFWFWCRRCWFFQISQRGSFVREIMFLSLMLATIYLISLSLCSFSIFSIYSFTNQKWLSGEQWRQGRPCERQERVKCERKRSHPAIYLLQISICLFEISLPSSLHLRARTLSIFLTIIELIYRIVLDNKKTLLSSLVNMEWLLCTSIDYNPNWTSYSLFFKNIFPKNRSLKQVIKTGHILYLN